MIISRLKQCRTAKGFTRKELATLAGVTPGTIRVLERAEMHCSVRWDTMRKLAAALELPINSVFLTR